MGFKRGLLTLRRLIEGPYLIPLLRLVLGGIFITASVGKLAFPAAEAEIVEIYAGIFLWLPYKTVKIYMVVLPWLELLLGTFLILGLFLRACGLACLFVILSFIGANAVLFRGAIGAHRECPACFGTLYVLSYQLALIIDIIMLLIAVLILLSHSRSLRLDLWLSGKMARRHLPT